MNANQLYSRLFRRSQVRSMLAIAGVAATVLITRSAQAAGPDYEMALKRAQYLLHGTVPTDDEYAAVGSDNGSYKSAIRAFLNHSNFYSATLRYHEILFGTGLGDDYLTELVRSDIDNKTNKVAKLSCNRADSGDQRYRCQWSSQNSGRKTGTCPQAWEQAVTVFWYPGMVAWVCPEVMTTCGTDLSQCLIEYSDPAAAKNAELGTTEIFDTHAAVTNSLSKQAAGLATAVVMANYPYTKILESGLTAVDGAIVHFMRQNQYFDMTKFNAAPGLADLIGSIALTDTNFRLVNVGHDPTQAGALSTFGWLRRYEKNRSRANQLYQRLLCRQFTSALPRVFPADPGNLRTTPGCMGCHSTVDPLADFFSTWGEGGELYTGAKASTPSSFDNKSGAGLADLADIIRNDDAFATCTVEHAWGWLMGRAFYRDEADLRRALTSYFVTVNYSFKELVYAMATHPAFIEGSRSDATVTDPLDEPPLGQPPGGNTNLPCSKTIDFTADIAPKLGQCTNCHFAGNKIGRQDISSAAQMKIWGSQSVNMMASGNMPPGQAGPPLIGPVWDLKEAVRCWVAQNP
ncbi:MAG: hypothetical protein NTZ90_09790 [Proteobacteria bacterium]|nr:hypothetical protein [Pseudomonadota bacterium]